MAQTHHLPKSLTTRYAATPSTAHWSIALPSRLVIFVHGFGGSVGGTWPDFPGLITNWRSFSAPFDAIFYQYDGVFTPAVSSALALRDFMVEFLKDPTATANKSLPLSGRRPSYTYDQVILVAHSLGAVVVRRALLDVDKLDQTGQPQPWLKHVRLVLFAPAHKGAYAADVLQSILGQGGVSLGGLLKQGVRYKVPLLADLQPGSPVLVDLEQRTQRALEKRAFIDCEFAIPATIVRAELDLVVFNLELEHDPPVVLEVGKDHTSVCKPKYHAESIFQHVAQLL